MSNILTIKQLIIQASGDEQEQEKPIVNKIDLTLERGKILGLIGESGAGKSTLGLASTGYTQTGCHIASGSIFFDSMDVLNASEKDKRKLRGTRISYVAQSAAASFNPAHRIIKQFAEGPVHHGLMSETEAEAKAKKIYARLDLPDPEKIGYRYPHQVSGGQLQRAMVAMAMAGSPDVIVFDEPTTALDVTTQIEVLAAIKEIVKDRSTAAIYISHDLAVVAQLADYIMVLRNGELVEEGAAIEILDNPKEEYTQQLLSVRNIKEHPHQIFAEDIILDIKNVSASYNQGDRPVVENIDLQITSGKTVAIVGESGSGKTSLARAITGLLPPFQGQVFFKGKELPPALKQRDRECLRELQMIYQTPYTALNPRQKVKQILGRPLEFYLQMKGKEQQKRIIELLEMTELPEHYQNRFPSELSGGEQQRVCIARALAAKPEMIICDEVTSALDQLVAKEILKLLQNIQNELNVTYLFITHDLATVKAIADEIVIMLQGKVVEFGTKQEILAPPYHKYTKLLLSSVPEMDPNWLDTLLSSRQ